MSPFSFGTAPDFLNPGDPDIKGFQVLKEGVFEVAPAPLLHMT
jgi:hypothetical protein